MQENKDISMLIHDFLSIERIKYDVVWYLKPCVHLVYFYGFTLGCVPGRKVSKT